ncbi:uncharacterized protein LOC108101287 [Drosophila ficusphila]|uniref:uncharacterized protein LOC108101287 n=1 Tax=Drosophila ficusphila TaxID=30025 RepID=UPI0007E6DDF6|nr:uncharacterized protein LOC108101287 [Drosophila ficusphila]
MTTWGNICRICSSPANYEIFAKIPTYLHGSTNEFLNWQKPINILLEETTGLKNSTDDGLPRNICAPCISYLKHAVTFREQCIKNALSLKLAELYQEKRVNISDANKIDKESALFTVEDLCYVEQRPVHNLLLNNSSKLEGAKDKVHKRLLNQTAPQLDDSSQQRIQYLNGLFNKQQHLNNLPRHSRDADMPSSSGQNEDEEEDYTVSSSDDNEEDALLRKHKNCYNYSETNFEEDDPMEQDQVQLRDIKVNIPEPMWRERKCPACSKRFMFEDSQESHLDNCVEYQFVTFVTEVAKLLEIRRQKMVSPHEFIRRMIFVLHKTCTWLQEHSIDSLLAEKLNQVKVSNGEKPAEVPISSDIPEHRPLEEQPFALFDFVSGTTTPITEENNVLYAIARSESRNSQSTPTVKKPIPIRGTATGSSLGLGIVPDKHKERATFLEKLQRAVVSPGTVSQGSAPIFSARCGQCNLVFDSVSELEVHNHSVHKGSELNADDEAKRRQIIALFEDDI